MQQHILAMHDRTLSSSRKLGNFLPPRIVRSSSFEMGYVAAKASWLRVSLEQA